MIRQRIADILQTISGIKRVYPYSPQSLADSDLPAAVLFAGPSFQPRFIGAEFAEIDRRWLINIYVTTILSGIDGEAEKKVDEWLTKLQKTMMAHPQLGMGTKDSILPFVKMITWQGDSGIKVLSFAGQAYLGIEGQINVTTLEKVEIYPFE